MTKLPLITAIGLTILAVAACEPTTSDGVVTRAPNAAEQACLLAVTRETNNPDVVLMGSEFSEAGTSVRVGVGIDRALWGCIAYSDGTTAGVEFLGNEGAA